MSNKSAAPWLDLWLSPFQMAATVHAATETMQNTASVLTKRLPMISEALASPLTANRAELARLVPEKLAAFQGSGKAASNAVHQMRSGMSDQASALGKLTAQEWLSPVEWWQVVERNVAIAVALAALPGAMLAPYQDGVSANAKRLLAR